MIDNELYFDNNLCDTDILTQKDITGARLCIRIHS